MRRFQRVAIPSIYLSPRASHQTLNFNLNRFYFPALVEFMVTCGFHEVDKNCMASRRRTSGEFRIELATQQKRLNYSWSRDKKKSRKAPG